MISSICKKYNIKNYTVNDYGSIDVNGDVDLRLYRLTELPLTFNKVNGNFYCNFNNLTTLKGSPRWVGGNFYCNFNNLTTLKGSPRWVGGCFSCSNNRLTSLEFSPDYVGDNFYCRCNKLIDNISDSEIGGYFYTILKQDGLLFDGGYVTNYNEWRKIYKRKQTLNELYTRHM